MHRAGYLPQSKDLYKGSTESVRHSAHRVTHIGAMSLVVIFWSDFWPYPLFFEIYGSFFIFFFQMSSNVYKCSQVCNLIINPFYVLMMIRLACLVSQSSKCKNL
jgi:Mn2+/Fe2+ NRAMP family transporter